MRVPLWTQNAWRLAALSAVAAWLVLAPLTTGAAMRTIQDMQGRQVAVPDPLTRVALFGGPTGQVAFILGAQDMLCAVTNTLKMSQLARTFYPRLAELPGPRTTNGSINVEELLAAAPQLVIAGDIDGEIVERQTPIPVAYFDDSMGGSLEDIRREIRFYARVFDRPERAERYIRHLDEVVAFLAARTGKIPLGQRKTVFNAYETHHLVTLGGDTYMQERIEIAGCRNAAREVTTLGKREGLHSGLGVVSMEQVLGWDPDIIVINSGTPEDLYTDPRWQSLKAIRTRQVYLQPAGIFIWNRPTAESAPLYPFWLACIAYPAHFADVAPAAEILRFYREIMEFPLTAEQAQEILSGGYERRIMLGRQPSR